MQTRTLSEIPESSRVEEADDKAKENENAPLETHRLIPGGRLHASRIETEARVS